MVLCKKFVLRLGNGLGSLKGRYLRSHGRVLGSLKDASLPLRQAIERALRLSARMQTDPEHPPAFWHSTLVRYHADRLPGHVRRMFTANRTARYGDVALEIGLLATDYNWQVAARLDA